ncbi:LacI family gluconate utilization system Gnt-I transcriptional repressor [Bradyrhizobium sp. USDA 4524]|uniref:LacI family DNA-binding transcriptional regulator n=1 Tax=unclassified Bradyrhizobium TaxID=2631580 RepID=UPI0020A0A03A|nr:MULTISPECIES: LacI family DNA-binding transcriptional regulator [unclassified Bradyrhizobium]MCP1837890.1 LacI family gluconate utilization system Gnt-I transcriptional repressor [Bradyrhizobium sp. USDA 4538]MCP1898454.1 LacI family gluconate utilization system Gnt-I transcriptional repressor [Bradyrhizobium sp. USDA 4537]MCP1987436.1 LacI family gluconate utilization system Gnt-I transcriptional repressor [Bradyrhizobium sp. USDA 4539]
MSSELTAPGTGPAGAAPTLSEVAKRAGVSSITVSRVVRMPDLVAPETRARVEQAMRDLGYIPNLVAGALASARTNSVGVLVPTIANSIFADTVQGLSDKLEPLGFSVILAQSRYDAEREDRMLAALLSRRPEAIIMVGSPATEEASRLLRNARIPIVETWDLPANPIDAVAGFDNYKAGVAVAKHLVAQGRKQLAFIGGDDPRGTRRWFGFRDEALASGLAEPRRLILDRKDSGSVAAHARLPGVDAVFAANDAHAIGFMSGLRKAGLLRDGPASAQPVAVIGLGDLEMGQLISPTLSTISVHGDAIGRTAATLTLERGGERRVDLGFELVLRDSG